MTSPPGVLVAKLGGSLLDWPSLPDALAVFLDRSRPHPVVLIVGGGAIVDALRVFDRTHGLGEERSHLLALRAMELTSHCLASLVPGLAVVDEVSDLGPAWEHGLTPILSPRRFLDLDDQTCSHPLPHRWDVTSDSIAARVADQLGAGSLVLLKSADAPPDLDPTEAAQLGLVDPYFPIVSQSLPQIRWRNLRDPDGEELFLRNFAKKM